MIAVEVTTSETTRIISEEEKPAGEIRFGSLKSVDLINSLLADTTIVTAYDPQTTHDARKEPTCGVQFAVTADEATIQTKAVVLSDERQECVESDWTEIFKRHVAASIGVRRPQRAGSQPRGTRLDITAVDHQPLEVWVIGHAVQELGPDARVPPAAEPAMAILPVPVVGSQVPPGSPSAQEPEHCVQKLAVIQGRCTFTQREVGVPGTG